MVISALVCSDKDKAAGPFCCVEEQRLCESKMVGVLKWWPIDNVELYEKCGVEGRLEERVEGLLTDVRTLANSKVSQLQEAGGKFDEAEEVLEATNQQTRSEASCCDHMKKHGKDVAQTQSTLHDMCERVTSDFPDIETSGGSTAPGQDAGACPGELRRMERAARPSAS